MKLTNRLRKKIGTRTEMGKARNSARALGIPDSDHADIMKIGLRMYAAMGDGEYMAEVTTVAAKIGARNAITNEDLAALVRAGVKNRINPETWTV